jgi:GWxTD domain-containing protein
MRLIQAWVETPGATALGWTLVHSLWEGALVALVLWAALRAIRSAQARYAASCVALVVLAAAFAFTFARELPEGRPHVAIEAKARGAIPGPPKDTGDMDSLTPRDSLGYLPWLAPVWMTGVLAFQLRGVMAWMGARRLRSTGVCAVPGEWRARLDQIAQRAGLVQRVLLLESCLAEVPVVIGYLRPAILLPLGLLAGLPAAQVEAILLHELAHIRRHDYLVNLAQMFVEGLLFYHPAVWWISAVIRAERENCCDDVVVATQGDAYGYASALAALEERRAAAGEAVLASTGGSLVKRIRRLLAQPEGPRAGLTPVFSAVILTVTLVGAMAAWPARPQAVPQGPLPAPLWHCTPDQFAKLQQPPPVQIAQAQIPVRKEGTETQPDGALATPYRKWLNEDVAYIITDEERATYKRLTTDAQREEFIEQFWNRRDPTPGTPENEMKEEHYRRIAYANEHFTTLQNLPGWKTDRGRIYITFGPPDEIDSHPTGGTYQRPAADGGGTVSTVPFEQWRYRYIQEIGNNIIIEFVDPTGTGEYRMTMDPAAKVAPATGAMVKAGTTVQIVGNNGVQISVPLDRYSNHAVNVYARITGSDGRVVKTFGNTVHGQMALSQFLALTPGSYSLTVAVKDLTAGTVASDAIPFEVK